MFFFYYDGILDVNRKVKLDITDQTVDGYYIKSVVYRNR